MSAFIADGQLAATTSPLLGVQAFPSLVNVTLFNRGTANETVYLTITRSGSTARVLASAILQPNESLYAMGIGLQPTDVLSGYSTDAASVDYLVSNAPDLGFVVFGRDATGAPKGASLLMEVRDLLWKIAPS